MANILEILRNTTGIHEDLLYEAADEIERLRSHIKELQYQVSCQYAEIKRFMDRSLDVDADLKDEDGFYK